MPLLLATTTASAATGGSTCQPNPIYWICTEIQGHIAGGNVLGPLIQDVLDGVLIFLLIVVAGQVLRRFTVAAVERTADLQVRALTRNVMTAFTWVFAAAGGLVAGGVNVLWVLTFGGVFSLAIGLAFQDLLRNVLAGIFILLEKPFRIGDQVTIAGQEGVVQTISLRTTALRTDDGRLAVLPNLTVFGSVILNSTAFDQRRYSLSLTVEPGAEPSELAERARAAMTGVAAISSAPAPTVELQTDTEGRRLVVVSYWLDQRAHDAESVNGELLSRVWATSGERAAGRTGPGAGAAVV